MMFPHTVTIYNVTVETDKTTYEDKTTINATVINGVLLDEVKASNVNQSGLTAADSVTLYIPTYAAVSNGFDDARSSFVEPLKYASLDAYDKSQCWTLSISGNGGLTYFAKGDHADLLLDFQTLKSKIDGVYSVTKVDYKDYGGLPHWEVGGA